MALSRAARHLSGLSISATRGWPRASDAADEIQQVGSTAKAISRAAVKLGITIPVHFSSVRSNMHRVSMGTTNQNRLWWRWRFAAPAAVVFVTIISSVVMLGEIQEQSGERLYALFAHTDSAGTGEIFWKKNGQAQAYATVELPYYIGLTFAVVATAVGTVGVKQNAGWLGLICLWIYGFMCVLVLSAVYVWLWINVNGLFI